MDSEIFIMRINSYVCLPLTALVIVLVFCLVKREQTPLIYYINLLIANLIQFIMTFIYVKHGIQSLIIYIIWMVGGMAGVYFRMFIAMERCFVITRPHLNWIRQTGKSVLVSVLVWIPCFATIYPCMALGHYVLFVVALLTAPLFILFLAWTFKALTAATSVPTDEKRRIVGTLVLLFIQYFLMIFFPIISWITLAFSCFSSLVLWYSIFGLFLLIPYVDLVLAFFLRKGPVDKLLLCLCCCITDKTVEDVVGYQQLHKSMLQQVEKEEVNQTV